MAILAFDTFNRANENPLSDGGNWSAGRGWVSAQLISDAACPSGLGNPASVSIWTGLVWPDDQWSAFTLLAASSSTSTLGCAVRWSSGTGTQNGYDFQGGFQIGMLSSATVYAWIAGTPNAVGSFNFTPEVGDVFKMEVVGTTISVYQNGILLASFTDSNISAGYPGFYLLDNDAFTNAEISGWQGGDTSAPNPTGILPASGAAGPTLDVTVSGTDFDANGTATISFSGTGITVNSYSIQNSTTITASITIAANAAQTARDVVVTNASDGQAGTLPAAFTVTPSGPTPPPNWSPVDSRDYGNFPNDFRVVQGSEIYDVPLVDSRAAGVPVDSRAAGAPEDSRVAPNIPENSRNPPPF